MTSAVTDADRAAQQLLTRLGALSRMPVSLIVDLDDTLISNKQHFDDARDALHAAFARLDREGRSREQLTAILDAANARNLPALGYTPQRWKLSAAQAAEQIAGRPLTASETDTVAQAAQVALHTGRLLPGVTGALFALGAAGADIHLLTKGCEDMQRAKLTAHRMADRFSGRVTIVTAKTPDVFAAVAGRCRAGQQIISIGDSARSDVIPALACGLDAILIDRTAHGATAWEAEDVPVDVPVCASFAEAVLQITCR